MALYEANDAIQKELQWSVDRRLAQLRQRKPFAYLDWVINELEEFHIRGWKRVPKHFMPSLRAVAEIQPDRIAVPERWPALIRDAIDTCFNLQEQLLSLRDPGRRTAETPPVPDYWIVPLEANEGTLASA
ncbi:MAG: hypothetical protein M3Z11_00405 [Candidatus Dormibacteraeota bacterium]|nr:hypothetical protein [Candidatus Dormibacteraeota bacterium]